MWTLDELLTVFHRSAKKAIRHAAVGLADTLGNLNDALAARRRRPMIATRKFWYRNAAIVVAVVLTVAIHQGTYPLGVSSARGAGCTRPRCCGSYRMAPVRAL